MRHALPPERTRTFPDNSLHFHPFPGFLVLNYWLHGYHTPEGVRSQLSSEAGIGSRRWVDAKQPYSSSTDLSHADPALFGEGSGSPTSSRTEAPSHPHENPNASRARSEAQGRQERTRPSRFYCFALWSANKQPSSVRSRVLPTHPECRGFHFTS